MMEEKNLPLISVVMPAYNAGRYIEAAIRSVQDQTYRNWELLVIDDGSRDETTRIVRDMAREDPRIRLYENPENMGTARTRNRGLDLSRGAYIALLDSDDLWLPGKLQKQYRLALKAQADIVYGSYEIVDEADQTLCRDFLVPERTDYPSLLKNNVIGCSTVLLRSEAIRGFRFTEEFYHEDYVLWLRLLQAGKKAVGVPEICVKYRVHSGGRAANKANSARQRWIIYRDCLKLPMGKSLYYLGCYAMNGLRKYWRRTTAGKDGKR